MIINRKKLQKTIALQHLLAFVQVIFGLFYKTRDLSIQNVLEAIVDVDSGRHALHEQAHISRQKEWKFKLTTEP